MEQGLCRAKGLSCEVTDGPPVPGIFHFGDAGSLVVIEGESLYLRVWSYLEVGVIGTDACLVAAFVYTAVVCDAVQPGATLCT